MISSSGLPPTVLFVAKALQELATKTVEIHTDTLASTCVNLLFDETRVSLLVRSSRCSVRFGLSEQNISSSLDPGYNFPDSEKLYEKSSERNLYKVMNISCFYKNK